jgi:ubiquitin-like-conjugating enzyme ATG3
VVISKAKAVTTSRQDSKKHTPVTKNKQQNASPLSRSARIRDAVLKDSAFLDKGMLTPEEFVRSGDYTVRVSGVWSWDKGDASKSRPYLPPNKQFLITKRVPCYRRVSSLTTAVDVAAEKRVMLEGEEGKGADEWIEPSLAAFGTGHDVDDDDLVDKLKDLDVSKELKAGPEAVTAAVETAGQTTTGAGSAAVQAAEVEDDEYADMSSFVGSTLIVAPSAPVAPVEPAGAPMSQSAVLRVRSYDISVTYDNYYRTPRVYLKGYDEDGVPLTPEQMLQDVMQDYANRTATMELHPHMPEAGPHISIHPCRHAQAMKRIVDATSSADGSDMPSVDHYLFIFLKFIASIIPTIEYDFTVAVRARGGDTSSSNTAVTSASGAGSTS